jgi:hypothetical protein
VAPLERLTPQEREQRQKARLAGKKRRQRRADRTEADPTVARLMRTIAECRELEKQTWTKLTTYLATGRTVVRERLYEDMDQGRR